MPARSQVRSRGLPATADFGGISLEDMASIVNKRGAEIESELAAQGLPPELSFDPRFWAQWAAHLVKPSPSVPLRHRVGVGRGQVVVVALNPADPRALGVPENCPRWPPSPRPSAGLPCAVKRRIISVQDRHYGRCRAGLSEFLAKQSNRA